MIDFNGEILISIWPRPAVRGQSHLLGTAGHPVGPAQSIIFGKAGENPERSTLEPKRKRDVSESSHLEEELGGAGAGERERGLSETVPVRNY